MDEIKESGGEAQCFTCDITNQSAVQTIVAKAVETFGPLRGVVANSGVGGANFPERMTDLILWFKPTCMVHTTHCVLPKNT